MPFTPLPPIPNRNQTEDEFVVAMNDFLAALPQFQLDANAIQTDLTSRQVVASDAADTAEAAAVAAIAAAAGVADVAALGVDVFTTVVTGTNTKALTYTPAVTVYATGVGFAFLNNLTNTGAVTVNLNSVGAVALQKYAGATKVAIEAGDLAQSKVYRIYYDGTDFVLLNPEEQRETPTAFVVSNSFVMTGAGSSVFEDVYQDLLLPAGNWLLKVYFRSTYQGTISNLGNTRVLVNVAVLQANTSFGFLTTFTDSKGTHRPFTNNGDYFEGVTLLGFVNPTEQLVDIRAALGVFNGDAGDEFTVVLRMMELTKVNKLP